MYSNEEDGKRKEGRDEFKIKLLVFNAMRLGVMIIKRGNSVITNIKWCSNRNRNQFLSFSKYSCIN